MSNRFVFTTAAPCLCTLYSTWKIAQYYCIVKYILEFYCFLFTLDVGKSPSGGKRPTGKRILFRGYQGCDSVPAKG